MSEEFLPRDLGSRVGMGCAATFFAFVWSNFVFDLTPRQFGFWETVALEIVREMLLTATIALSLLVVWCVAMPRWIERLFKLVLKKLYLMIGAGLLTLLVVAACLTAWRAPMN